MRRPSAPRVAVAVLSLLAPCALLMTSRDTLAQDAPATPSTGSPASSAPSTPTTTASAPSSAPAGSSRNADAVDVPAEAIDRRAAVVDPNAAPYIPVVTVRRSGLTLEAMGGFAFSSAKGTRQKFSLRGPETGPGLAAGYSYEFFLGGALTDWFVFHLGGGASHAERAGLKVTGFNVLFGAEVWPLFWRGGMFTNLGVGLDFGTGSASIVSKSDKFDVRAEGTSFSAIRTSVFYDARLVGGLNFGPLVSYEARFTDIYTEHLVTLGARAVYYNGP